MKRILLISLLCIFHGHTYAQPGSIDLTFNPFEGTIFDIGSSSTVNSTSIQSDGKIIVGGYFTSINGKSRNRIARLNTDGSLDLSFNPGTGFDFAVNSISIQTDGKIIVGGYFKSFNGTERKCIARLNTDGSLDTSFNPGAGFDKGYGVKSTSIQSDGKIIVGGDFSYFNGTGRNRIARLNSDGSLDVNFNIGVGFDYGVSSISIQSDDKIIVGGRFTSFNGTARKSIARLNNDGSLDDSFNSGTGFDYSISSISIQEDRKIIVAGDFTSFKGTTRIRIARLNTDGSLDISFNPGTGFDQHVKSTTIQADGKIIVGGPFKSFNGIARKGIVRLNTDGSIDTSFNPGTGFDFGVESISIQEDGKIIVGGDFSSYNGKTINRLIRLN